MLRTLIQWLICQKVDDGKPLGVFLDRLVRFDAPTRRFYEDLAKLNTRLRKDASILLENSGSGRCAKPLGIVSRSVIYATRKTRSRTVRRAATISALTASFLLVSGFFLSVFLPLSGEQVGSLAAQTGSEAAHLVSISIQDDPAIHRELLQLCRTTDEGAGPFLIGGLP